MSLDQEKSSVCHAPSHKASEDAILSFESARPVKFRTKDGGERGIAFALLTLDFVVEPQRVHFL